MQLGKNLSQEQNAEAGSSAIQAGGNVTIGVSYSEARQIAIDVFDANFYRLADKAGGVASERAQKITERYLARLIEEHPNGLASASDPDFQYALFKVQKEFARTGDQDLGELLVDLLVDRSKVEQRSIMQIVLNEAIGTAPKLTEGQLATLSVVFLMRYSRRPHLSDRNAFGEFLDVMLLPFLGKFERHAACVQHLEFSGCATKDFGSELEKTFKAVYQGLFFKGLERTEIEGRQLSIGVDPRFFMTCFNDDTKYQIRALNRESLMQLADREGINSSDKTILISLFEIGQMNESEVKASVIELRPYMDDLFNAWKQSLGAITLTSVGIAIGHANIKKSVGSLSDLSIWIH